MSFWEVVADTSSVVTIGGQLQNTVPSRIQEESHRFERMIDYTVIARDLHDIKEEVSGYLTRCHSQLTDGRVFSKEEEDLFYEAFFKKYPNLAADRVRVEPYLRKYWENLEAVLHKEMSLSQRVILNENIDTNSMLRELITWKNSFEEERRAVNKREPRNANLLYADSFCETLFLHKDRPNSKVNLQSLYVASKCDKADLVKRTFAPSEVTLEEELCQFFASDKVALFIEGDAGAGKSTLVSWMNYHYELQDETAKRLYGERPVVSIRLRELDWVKIGQTRLMNALLAYLNFTTIEELRERYPNAIMILDGFDELCMIEEDLSQYERLISDAFRRNLPGFQFVITTRPKFLDILKIEVPKGYLHLRHFDREQRIDWLEKYKAVADEPVSDFVEEYIYQLYDDDDPRGGDSDATAVCDIPMTLYMIVAKRITEEALTNHWALYRQIFHQELSETEYNRMFITKDNGDHNHRIYMKQELLYEISEEIAYEMYKGGNQKLQMSGKRVEDIIRRLLEESPWECSSEAVANIASRCYALCTYWKADVQKGFVEFYHNNIRDFFLCERVCRGMNQVREKTDELGFRELSKLAPSRAAGKIAFTDSIDMIIRMIESNYSYRPLETKVCQFLYQRSIAEKFGEPDFYDDDKFVNLVELAFDSVLKGDREFLVEADYTSQKKSNPFRMIINCLTCMGQIARYTSEKRLKDMSMGIPYDEEVLFHWWKSDSNEVNEYGLFSLVFREIFHCTPVTFDDGTIIALSSKTDFSGLNLEGCDLREIDFSGCNLESVNFRNAILDRSDLRSSHHGDTSFEETSTVDVAW